MSFSRNTISKMLPKAYLRKYVADQIYVALIYFKNLVPVMNKYVYNDGTIKHLMSLTGTIPVMISGMTYNIPICIWLEPNYPQSVPICYVKPTREMMVVKGKYVMNNGKIQLPYLKEWKSGECDLVSLLQVMAAMFGEFPPVCMKPQPEHEQASYVSSFIQRTSSVQGVTTNSTDVLNHFGYGCLREVDRGEGGPQKPYYHHQTA